MQLQDAEKLLHHHFVGRNLQDTAWVDTHSRDRQIVWFCLLMLADGIGGFYFILSYFYGGSPGISLV